MGTIIVGNSASLLKHEHGAFIDSFEQVVRFNKALTTSYSQHVGSKFTMWATSELFDIDPVFERMYWITVPRCMDDAILFAKNKNIPLKIVPYGHRFSYTKKLLNLNNPGRLHLTTGIAFVMYAVDVLKWTYPTVIGFDGYSDESNWCSYYNNKDRKERYKTCNKLHINILKKLNDIGKIKWIQL